MKMTLKKMLMVLVCAAVMAGVTVPAFADEIVETPAATEEVTVVETPVVTVEPTPVAVEVVIVEATPVVEEEPVPVFDLVGEETTEAPVVEEATEAPVVEEATEAPVVEEPTEVPTEEPTEAPTEEPTEAPTEEPTQAPTEEPTQAPTEVPAVPFTGTVEVLLMNEGDIYFGDVVTLVCKVTDANTAYEIRWEVFDTESNAWIEILDEDEKPEELSFIVTEENCELEYRVVLITEA